MSDPHLLERSTRQSAPTAFDGSSRTYGPFDFQIHDPADVVVELREIGADLWILTDARTVTKGAAEPDYFTITFDAIHPASHEFRVRGKRVHERTTSLSTGKSLNLDALSREQQQIAMVLQELRRDVDWAELEVPQQVALVQALATGWLNELRRDVPIATGAAERAESARQSAEVLATAMAQLRGLYEGYVELARKFADSEGQEPGGPGTRSAKEWALVSGQNAQGHARNIGVEPVGDIASTNVQDALAELDSEKANLEQVNEAVTTLGQSKADLTGAAFTGAVTALHLETPSSPSAGVSIGDRVAEEPTWVWYAHGGVLRAFVHGVGDIIQIAKTKVMTVLGDLHASGNVFAGHRVVVGEGKDQSWINMIDDESPNGLKYIHANGNLIGFVGGDGSWKFYVTEAGALWCAQLGDINSRIESRASAWAATRAGAGAQVQHNSGVQEFARIDINSGGTTDLPAPWVMTGIRIYRRQTDNYSDHHLYPRGVWLRNQ